MSGLTRRGMLGASAASLAPLPAIALPTPPAHPDAELIRVCAEFAALERQWLAMFDTIEDDDQREVAQRPIHDVQEGLLDRIYNLPPSTHQGAVALAQTLALWDAELLKETDDEGWGQDLIVTLVRGLIGGVA